VVKKRDDSSPFTCARLDSGYWIVLAKESINGGHHLQKLWFSQFLHLKFCGTN
jgi:hypothetical protein